MLQIKDSDKLFEFKTYFEGHTRVISALIDMLRVFSCKSVIRNVFADKSKGFSCLGLLEMMILMPFLGAKNISNLFSNHYQVFYKGKKDALYDSIRTPFTNWRKMLLNFCKRFLKKVGTISQGQRKTFFIADDTDLEKRTPYFECLSRVFNHVIGRHIYAYKALVLGYSDGVSFVPVDFSFHNEKGKKKDYGLTAKQRKNQYRKDRVATSHGAKRIKEVRTQKGTNLIRMVKRAVKQGIMADYLLTDSWFLCENMIAEIRKIKNGAIHVLSMCRMDKRKYLYNGKKVNATDLRKQEKANVKRSKKHRVYYICLDVEYKGHKVRLFFTRLNKRSKWRLLVTTDTKLTFTEAFEAYANRWAIEVFFKECKQNLGLGKNQSRDFDAQIASTTICFVQYIILSLYKRCEKYETIGGVFRECKEGIMEQVLSDKIKALLLELIQILAHGLNLDIDMEEVISTLIDKIEIDNKIKLIFSTPDDRGGKKLAA